MLVSNLAKVFAFLTLASSMAAVGCAAPAPSSEEEGETGSYLLAGPILTAAQVAGYVRGAGFPEAMVGKMVCTAKYESSFYEKASNGSHFGLFQIARAHLGESASCASSVSAIEQPANNAKCAFAIYKAQGMGAWSAYTSHRSECDRYRAPGSAAAPVTTSPSDGTSTVPLPPERPSDLGDPDVGTSSPDLSGGGCYSATLQTMTDELACVQSTASSGFGLWFQCHEGQWYRGGDNTSGPFGACGSAHALDQGNTGDFATASLH